VRDFVIVDVNARAAAQLRTPREALAGRRLAELLPLEPWLFEEIARVAERGAAFERELPDLDPRARGRWVQLQIVPLGDGVMMTSRDVTERRRAVDELEAREERYRTMARYFPNGMVALLDRELCFLVADGAGLTQVGFTRDDLEGRRLVDTFPAHVVGHLAPTLEAALRGEEAAAEVRFHSRTYSTLAVPVRDGAGAVTSALLIAQDVTERAEMERLKSELVATVSHELRTPLTSIRGALGLMEAGTAGALPEQAGMLVRIARSNTDRLIRLVNDVLDLEKIEARKVDYRMQTLRAIDVVGPAAEGMQGAALLAGVRIVQDVRSAHAFVGDRDRLLQVLTNLLSNAVKFAPPGSEVVLRATDDAARHGTLRLVVEGAGPGIPADKLGGLFEKFHQVDASDARARGGTGLGLAITRAIVEQHGGVVGVESEPGVRTAFWCELPAA
jgi:PAS domain S-box-containing protein